EKALVFSVSYSGDTEETLTAFEEARLRRRANVVAITSNGRLKERAAEEGLPLIEIPTGYQPRAALGYLFLPILVILGKVGLVSDKTESIEEAIEILKVKSSRFAVKSLVGQNDAKRLAAELYGKIPIIYGAEGISSAAALRWKAQLHENSKIPAFYNVFSELNHNEIVGWEMLEEKTQIFDLIVLRHPGEYERNKKRIEITLPMIRDHLYSVTEVWAEGESDVARLLSLIYIGDFTSAYLAVLYGVDPTPVERIKLLKEKLQQGNVEADL
ncbi:MAG: bifunctional phosphoglucose/phosphomannose isomerase, partial [Actinomycetota bacterium]